MDYENNDIDIMEQLDDSFEDEFFGSEIKDEEDLYNEDEEKPKSGRRKKNEDGGFSRLGIHNELPLDASPSPEKLTLIYQYVHSGDPELRQEGTLQMCGIMASYILYLITKNYNTYSQKHMQDMLAEGYAVVCEEIDKYDPRLGAPSTFFSRYIDHGIQGYINKNVHHSSFHFKHNEDKIEEARKRLTAAGMPITIANICIEADVSAKTAQRCLQTYGTRTVSIDANAACTSLKSGYETPEEAYMKFEDEQECHRLLANARLSEQERILTLIRYGFLNSNNKNVGYNEIQSEALNWGYDLTIPEVKKILGSAMRKLKDEKKRESFEATKKKAFAQRDRAKKHTVSGGLIPKEALEKDLKSCSDFFDVGIVYVN